MMQCALIRDEADSLFVKYIAVALTAASPIGEELVSIPLGIGLGLDAAGVALVSFVFNLLPALVISGLFHWAEQGSRVVRMLLRLRPAPLRYAVVWVLRRRNRLLTRWLDRWGVWGALAATPWAGVYATTLTLELMGMRRSRLLSAIAASLLLHAILFALLSEGVLRLIF